MALRPAYQKGQRAGGSLLIRHLQCQAEEFGFFPVRRWGLGKGSALGHRTDLWGNPEIGGLLDYKMYPQPPPGRGWLSRKNPLMAGICNPSTPHTHTRHTGPDHWVRAGAHQPGQNSSEPRGRAADAAFAHQGPLSHSAWARAPPPAAALGHSGGQQPVPSPNSGCTLSTGCGPRASRTALQSGQYWPLISA